MLLLPETQYTAIHKLVNQLRAAPGLFLVTQYPQKATQCTDAKMVVQEAQMTVIKL